MNLHKYDTKFIIYTLQYIYCLTPDSTSAAATTSSRPTTTGTTELCAAAECQYTVPPPLPLLTISSSGCACAVRHRHRTHLLLVHSGSQLVISLDSTRLALFHFLYTSCAPVARLAQSSEAPLRQSLSLLCLRLAFQV